MATTVDGKIKSYNSTNNLSAKQFYIVKLDTDQNSVVLASAATDYLIGTLTNKPLAGENAAVAHRGGGGTCKVILGGSVSAGDHLTADSAGKAVATTTGGNEVLGRALKDGVSGDIIEYTPSNEKYRTS